MRSIDKLQDIICICDYKGVILDSNNQFKKRVFSHTVSNTNVTQLNFIDDLLHQDHQKLFSTAVKLMESNSSLPVEEQHLSVSLGTVKTLSSISRNSCKYLHIYQPLFDTT
jgi:hypothetical protein